MLNINRKILLTVFLVLVSWSLFAGDGVYNILDFGATGDGKALCTQVIQQAVDNCAKDGGGKVIIPPGSYLTGPIFLQSNLSIELFPGAKLIFSDQIEETPIVDGRWEGIERPVYASLFTGHNLENVSIIGRGTIEGQGENWWEAFYKTSELRKKHGIRGREPDNPEGSPLKVPRPRLINLYHCKNVLISELTFLNSPSWTIHPVYCTNVTIEKVSIIQPYHSPNTDGINPESCKNVRITNCFVDCGDDCVTIKSGYNEDGRSVGIACENIVISNCTFAHGRSAVGIGSEMSGDVRNVTISNCVFNGTLRGLRLKTSRGRGGIVENYRADNIVMNNVETAISIDMYYGKRDHVAHPITEKTPVFKNIHISNITATDVKKSVDITGLPESWIEGISIHNSNFQSEKGMSILYVNDLRLSDVQINTTDGRPLKISSSKNIEIDNVSTNTLASEAPLIELSNVSNSFIHSCHVLPGLDWFLEATECSDINFGNNLLRDAKVNQ